MTQGKSCCFTGHRPQSLPWGFREEDARCRQLKARLRQAIERMIVEQGVRHFISGMAIGVDTWAAEIVLEMKKIYPVTLECAIPCRTQAERWSAWDRRRWHQLIAQCDRRTVLQSEYSPACFDRRNRYMVQRSDFVIAVWNGLSSGTGKTVAYARQMGRQVVVLEP